MVDLPSLLGSILTTGLQKSAERFADHLVAEAVHGSPALQAKAKNNLINWMESVERRLMEISKELASLDSVRRNLEDPGFVLFLDSSSKLSMRIDRGDKHEVLAGLVVQRALLDSDDRLASIRELAAEHVHRLSKHLLAILGYLFILQKSKPRRVQTDDRDSALSKQKQFFLF